MPEPATRPDLPPSPRPPGGPVREVAWVFLKLGTIGFGGPAAHVALMEDEVVRRRRWVTRERFLDLLGATNLIPGPNSTEMAIHLGLVRAGWRGLLAGGACFILPATLIVLALAAAYGRWGRLPAGTWLLYGVKPVIIAVVVQALWALGRKALGTPLGAAVGAAVAAGALLGVNEVALLFLAALLVPAVRLLGRAGGAKSAGAAGIGALLAAGAPAMAVAAPAVAAPAGAGASLVQLTLVFLKVGSILFGSGYVLLAFLRPDLVVRTGWLGDRELLDAIAVGQLTPGPVLTTATFVGYLVAGVPGALLATVGIFLPSFVLVAASSPVIPRLRRSAWASGFLDGANAASVALMAVVTWQLGRAAVVDLTTAGLAAAAAVAVFATRLNSAWLVLAGAAAGALAAWLR